MKLMNPKRPPMGGGMKIPLMGGVKAKPSPLAAALGKRSAK